MGRKKHPFIDKKHAQKFTLVHRSQRDPLQADEDSAQRVLIPSSRPLGGHDERVEHGIYFDDDYDYMQHLRPRGEGDLILADGPNEGASSKSEGPSKEDKGVENKVSFGSLLLPKEVLPSAYEEDEGLLSKGVLPRGPQPDWDPDIVAALDDALDLDDPGNVLEDDFIAIANADLNCRSETNEVPDSGSDGWETEEECSGEINGDEDLSDFDLESDFSQEETKSRFTNYSMTSSVIRRTEELKLLDDHFEKIMEEYDADDIGGIDQEEVGGALRHDAVLLTQALEEFEEDRKLHTLAEVCDSGADNTVDKDSNSDEEDDDRLFAQFEKDPKELWDCESIISTYSNIYNHPKFIVEEKAVKPIKVSARTGLPLGVLRGRENADIGSEDADNVSKKLADGDGSAANILLPNRRGKDETSEERRLRKQAIKSHKKSRRVEKKTNRLAFKSEELKQERLLSNTVAQQGIRL